MRELTGDNVTFLPDLVASKRRRDDTGAQARHRHGYAAPLTPALVTTSADPAHAMTCVSTPMMILVRGNRILD